MKNFLFALLVFCILAACSGATAGQLINSAEWSRFDWRNSGPVTVALTIRNPADNGYRYANTAEIMRRLQLQGLDRLAADNLLFGALNELYECPYLEYHMDMADLFPRDIEIVLIREFNAALLPHSGRVVSLLAASGLKHNEAQSLYYNAIDEHLGCLLEP